MATTRKTSSRERSSSKTSPSKANASKKATVKKEAAASLSRAAAKKRHRGALIAVAISLILAAILIVGQTGALGSGIKSFFAGLFGFSAFLVPVIIFYVALMVASDKPYSSVKGKVLQGFMLLLLICAASHIFISGTTGSQISFKDVFEINYLKSYFDFKSTGWLSGGVLGAILGGSMLVLFDKPISIIISLVLIVLFLLLVSSVDLLDCIAFFAKLFKKQKKEIQNDDNNDTNEIITQDPIPVKHRPRFNPDVDLGPGYADGDKEDDGLSLVTPVPQKKRASTKKEETVPVFDIPEEAENASDTPIQAETHEVQIDDLIERATASKKAEKPEKVTPVDVEIPEESLEPSCVEYIHPPITLLNKGNSTGSGSPDELKANAERLVDTLRSFGIETRILNISCGPTVTRYELQPSAGVKISRITSLADDIAMNLAASGVRIEAPIPNKSAVGIEVPNKAVKTVNLREVVDSTVFRKSESKLTVSLGRDIGGEVKVADLSKMPHMLIAGATGSGKSVCINSFIVSLLYKATPDEVKMIMIDPKMVELGNYNGIPHLLIPVVTDPRKAAGALNWAVSEMTKRYNIFASHNVKDINSYNRLAQNTPELLPMARIVIIIDELADLMMVSKSEVEDAIVRLAQLARAAGMHLVIATQRPSVNVITGLIKANVPSRIAFAVTSHIDSRTILDGGGAEKLLGRGDMLFAPIGSNKPERIQGCFVSEGEVDEVIKFVRNNYVVNYDENIQQEIERLSSKEKSASGGSSSGSDNDEPASNSDEKLMAAIEVVINAGAASTSLLQRKLSLGYARAAKIMDEMEERGIIGPSQGSKPREVLMSRQQWLEMNMMSDEPLSGSDNADFGE